MVRFLKILPIVFLSVALTIGCGTGASAAQSPQALTVYILGPDKGVMGPDGQPHEAFVPSNVVIKAGKRVRLTFINYSRAAHNFVQPQLDLDLVIGSGSAQHPTTMQVVFTPARAGVYRWFCSLPCDADHGMWAMGKGYGGPSKEGFMAGNIVVL